MKRDSEDFEDRRELAAAKKRNAGKLGTPLHEATDVLDYADVLEARAKDAGRPRLSHKDVRKRYS